MHDHTDELESDKSIPPGGTADPVVPTPSQGGRSGGNLQRDIATQAEEEHLVDGKTGITRVRGEDERHD